MALRDFVIDLMENLLDDEELGLREQDLRFYDEGTTAESDKLLDDHIRWRNARYFNVDSNVIRSSLLIVQIPLGENAEYINFHVGDLYRRCRTHGMDKILPLIKRDIKDVRASAAGSLAIMNQFEDYEAMKEHLILRPLNYDDNTASLAKGIYRQVGDIALVLYISLGTVNHGTAINTLSSMVPREMFRGWALEEQEVLDRALENTMRLQPPMLFDLTAALVGDPDRQFVPFMDDESVSFDFDDLFAPVLTTQQQVNGAIATFYPGVLDRLCRMAGGDVYVVFTSISDVHIHLVGGRQKVSSMRSVLADTNREMNKPGETLTRQIYRYSAERKELTVV